VSDIYAGDIGTVILLNTGVDVSAATVKKMRVRKPSGTVVEWTATTPPGQNNYLTYTTIAGDIDQAGVWSIQAQVTMASWSGVGNVAAFVVLAKL
jgi:hypothetical protein